MCVCVPCDESCRREHWDSLLLALDVSLGGQLLLVVRVHAPVTTLAKPEPFFLTWSLHKVLVQRKIVANGVLYVCVCVCVCVCTHVLIEH